MGLQNGAVRVQEVEDGDIGQLGAHWTLNAHDNHYGHVSHVAMSFDGMYVRHVIYDHAVLYTMTDVPVCSHTTYDARLLGLCVK